MWPQKRPRFRAGPMDALLWNGRPVSSISSSRAVSSPSRARSTSTALARDEAQLFPRSLSRWPWQLHRESAGQRSSAPASGSDRSWRRVRRTSHTPNTFAIRTLHFLQRQRGAMWTVPQRNEPEILARFRPKAKIVTRLFVSGSGHFYITARYVEYIGDENASRAPALLQKWSSAMQRHHFKQTQTLEERLGEAARQHAKLLPHGAERDDLIRKARQAETGSHMSEWLRSTGLQPPK
jgi:hypothetical protein